MMNYLLVAALPVMPWVVNHFVAWVLGLVS